MVPWTKIVAILLAPPGLFILVALLAVLIGLRWRLIGRILLILDFAALAFLSLPHTGRLLLTPLESSSQAVPITPPDKADGEFRPSSCSAVAAMPMPPNTVAIPSAC